jgi:hypothetical protein
VTEHDPYAEITPADSAMTFTEAFSDPEFLTLAIPEVGEGGPCFDFDLVQYDFSSGRKVETDTRFHLAERVANQPVALIFGSYT